MTKIKVPIIVLDRKIQDLGLEQEDDYTDFCFNSKQFVGYWNHEDEEHIIFYVGADSYMTPNTKETVILFNQLLEK